MVAKIDIEIIKVIIVIAIITNRKKLLSMISLALSPNVDVFMTAENRLLEPNSV